MIIRSRDYTLDPSDPNYGVEKIIEIGAPELEESLARAREEWARLKAAGTPYWCVHEGREVDHPRAQWQDDQPEGAIHRKHGVMCLDCGGYIQEG